MLALLVSLAAAPLACPVPAGWRTSESVSPIPYIAPMSNVIRVKAGRTTWNGVPIDDATLKSYIERMAELSPTPRLIIDTSEMDCPTLTRLIAITRSAGLDCTRSACLALDYPPPPPPPAPPRRRY